MCVRSDCKQEQVVCEKLRVAGSLLCCAELILALFCFAQISSCLLFVSLQQILLLFAFCFAHDILVLYEFNGSMSWIRSSLRAALELLHCVSLQSETRRYRGNKGMTDNRI
ncbi:hypothetical protein CRENBAI_023148 [Crenichthys baileyi]|uniref:Uncharacterized protein n=1 Tax=Crenichthys baileyi TaxID=28760 RepID=A0AAV9SGW7_9TELE